MIRNLADNSQLPHALRSLAKMPGAELATARDVRVFLAEYSEGFNGRITNNSRRVLQPAALAADA